MWVISACIVLFTSIIVEWNTSTCESKHQSTFESFIVIELVHEPGIVMIVNEKTEGAYIFEFSRFFSISVPDVMHIFLASENISDCVVHRVVEKARDMILIVAHIIWVSIEDFSHLENTSCGGELIPVLFWNFWDGIDSNTVKVVVLN